MTSTTPRSPVAAFVAAERFQPCHCRGLRLLLLPVERRANLLADVHGVDDRLRRHRRASIVDVMLS